VWIFPGWRQYFDIVGWVSCLYYLLRFSFRTDGGRAPGNPHLYGNWPLKLYLCVVYILVCPYLLHGCFCSILLYWTVDCYSPLHPSMLLNRARTFIGWRKGGNITSAGWQVTLCDPVWYMSSRSSGSVEANCCKLLYTVYLLTYWSDVFCPLCEQLTYRWISSHFHIECIIAV